MKYIDADKLIAEINNRLMSVNLEELGNLGCHRVWAYNDVKDIVSSLQQEQPEVDLEKGIDAFFDKWDKNSNGGIFDENGAPVTIKTIKGVVKHFLNSRKEE